MTDDLMTDRSLGVGRGCARARVTATSKCTPSAASSDTATAGVPISSDSESTMSWRISSSRIEAFIARVTRSSACEVLASWRARS